MSLLAYWLKAKPPAKRWSHAGRLRTASSSASPYEMMKTGGCHGTPLDPILLRR